MESFPYWALSRGFGNRDPNVVAPAVRFPIPPSRFFGTAYGARVMLSPPPSTNTAPARVLMARAAALIAARPDEQRRLKVRPATETGNPAGRGAIRATFRLSCPAWFAQPRYTSSTKAGSTPARRTTSPTTSAPRSSGRTSLSAPWCRPIGVRTAPTITASVILEFPQSPHRTGGFGLRGHDAHSRHFRTPPRNGEVPSRHTST